MLPTLQSPLASAVLQADDDNVNASLLADPGGTEAHLLNGNDPEEESAEGGTIPEGSTRGDGGSGGRQAINV